jgi:ABC-type antimicrobial peptide transport system permease subunit
MKKGTLIGLVIAIVLAAGLYVLLTNSHTDFFPGTSFERNWETNEVTEVEGMVSLMYVDRGEAELSIAGWILAGIVILVIPMLIGWFIARMMNKKSAQKQTA